MLTSPLRVMGQSSSENNTKHSSVVTAVPPAQTIANPLPPIVSKDGRLTEEQRTQLRQQVIEASRHDNKTRAAKAKRDNNTH